MTKRIKKKIKLGKLPAGQIVKTQKEAADYAGVDERTIRRWQDNGMPVVKGGGYFKAILDHYKKTGGRDYDEDLNRHKKAEADVKEIKAKLLALELKIKQGRLLPAENIDIERIKRISAVKRQLLGLPRKLAPRMEGKNEGQRLEMLKAEIEYCIRIFSGENIIDDAEGASNSITV